MIERDSRSRLDAMASVFALALESDPLKVALVARDGKRLQSIFQRVVGHAAASNHLMTNDAGSVGLVWEIRTGPVGRPQCLLYAARLIAAYRSKTFRAYRLFVELDEHVATHRHAYVEYFGTEPSQQGQGLGSRLLSSFLTTIDHDALDCYLETSKEANIDFYARFGFEVVTQRIAWGDGPTYCTDHRRSAPLPW